MNELSGHLPRMYKTVDSSLSTAAERKKETDVGGARARDGAGEGEGEGEGEREREREREITASLFLNCKLTHLSARSV